MNIYLQIKTIIFSFIFGFGLSFVISLFYKFIYSNNKFVQIIFSLLLVLLFTLLYFLLLKKINNAIFHVYEILSLIWGYGLELFITGHIAKRKK